jgi:hypothetical protein
MTKTASLTSQMAGASLLLGRQTRMSAWDDAWPLLTLQFQLPVLRAPVLKARHLAPPFLDKAMFTLALGR